METYIAEYLYKTGEKRFCLHEAKNDDNAMRDALDVVKRSQGVITEVVAIYKIADRIY